LMQGSRDAGEFFERDPAGFAETFRRYHHEVAPTESFPMGEARLWAAWITRPSGSHPAAPRTGSSSRRAGRSPRR
jgi:hypothetical protein